jgi:SAM-dependent methyltransferase
VTWDQLRQSYDRVAAGYEARFAGELADKPRDRQLLDAFAAAITGPVVDLGSGPGHIGARVRDHGRWTVAVDASAAMAGLAAGRLDAAAVADMRSLPLAAGSVGGVVAFYSLIHVRRPEVAPVLAEIERVLRPGGRLLLSAHEGDGEIVQDEFLGEPVPFVATLFGLDELATAIGAAGMEVLLAEKQAPVAGQHASTRLYLEARRTRPA